MTRCCVVGCNNDGTYRFPSSPTRKKKWIDAVRRKNFEPKKSSRLCREHFVENDFIKISLSTGLPPAHKFLKNDAVPSNFPWTQKTVTKSSIARVVRYDRRCKQKVDHILQPSASQDPLASPSQDQNVSHKIDYQDHNNVIHNTQCNNDNKNENEKQFHISVGTQTSTIFGFFSSDTLLTDDESVYYYTGLENIEKFRLVLSTLMPMAEDIEYRWSKVISISTEDQFLLFLMKLRQAKPDFELGKMFGLSKTQVSNIFITWVNFVSDVWSLVDIWPSRDLVDYYMPAQFKRDQRPTRVIIDCTEIPIAKPSDPAAQQITFSSNKNRNTIKFLAGSTPGGLLSYCSEGFGGSTSDRQMIERSTLMNLCDGSDSILADSAFNVEDLLAPHNIGVDNPTLFRQKSRLPGLTLPKDGNVESQRVHIQQLIGMTKIFKILKHELNKHYVPLASKIFFTCVMLCNFRECTKNKEKQ